MLRERDNLFMKKILIASVILASVPFATFAQTATSTSIPVTPAVAVTLPDPGLVPGDFFYFLDRWGEGIGNFFTFGTENKARRALAHAEERASELNAVLAEKGSKAPEVAQAQQDFQNELSHATQIVADAKAKGSDVTTLAQDVSAEFERSKEMLKEAYRNHHDQVVGQEQGLKNALEQARKAGDQTAIAELQSKIDAATTEGDFSLEQEGLVDDNLDNERANLDNVLGEQRAAQVHIMNAMRNHEDALRAGVGTTTLGEYDSLMMKASEAMKAGDFQTAKDYAKDARTAVHDTERVQMMKKEASSTEETTKDTVDMNDMMSEMDGEGSSGQ